MLENEVYQIAPFNIDHKNAIFFDIETDIACKRVWLIGLQINGEFTRLYADDWKQEKEILVEFAKILADNPDRTLISFSCTNFDYRITLGAMQRHGMNTDCLVSRSHIDLCILLRRCFIFPNQRFALKDLGFFFEYPFRNPDLDGLAVALAYHRHTEGGKPLDNRILEYNEDDVKVLPFLASKAYAYSQETESA
jgi:predicted RecB family nuclease